MIKFYLRGDKLIKKVIEDEFSDSEQCASESEQAACDYGRFMGRKEAMDSLYIELQGIIMKGV